MIECTAEYIYYKKRHKRKRRKLLPFITIILLICGVFFYYKFVVLKQIFNISSEIVSQYSAESVNQATLISLSQSVNYSDLITIEKDDSGKIVYMSSNSYKINDLSRKISASTERLLKNKIKDGVPIPIMAFSGIQAISGYGKEVNYKTVAISKVNTEFKSDFISAGLNQTLHSIYIVVEVEVSLISPFGKENKRFNTPVLVSESVIVGSVPETYLNGKLFN